MSDSLERSTSLARAEALIQPGLRVRQKQSAPATNLLGRVNAFPASYDGYVSHPRGTRLNATAELLNLISGSVHPSINDVLEIRRVFRGFALEEANLLYSVSGGKGQRTRELTISN